MFNFKKDEKIDIKNLNEVIKTGKLILKILFVLCLVSLLSIFITICKSTGVFNLIFKLLSLLTPLFLGFIFAWLLEPLVSFLKTKRVPRFLGAALAYILFLSCIFLIFYMILPLLSNQINELVKTIPNTINLFNDGLDNFFMGLNNNFNYDFSEVKNTIYTTIESFTVSITNGLPMLGVNFIKGFASGIWNFVFSLIVGFYMLLGFPNIRKTVVSFLPKKMEKGTDQLIGKLDETLRHYIQGTLVVTILIFTTCAIGFTAVGIKAGIIFGLFCGITNIIPYIGPYIGGIPVVIVGFSISPTTGVLALIVVVIVQFLESMFIQPLVMSKAMKLHPVTIVMALLVFGYFFGIVGMIFATPVMASLKVLFSFLNEKFHLTKIIIGKEIEEEGLE